MPGAEERAGGSIAVACDTFTAPPIRFKRFDPEKFIQVASYLTARCRLMTKKKLLKLIYFADKDHLLRYGRPVLNDYYVNMDQGPVASQSYDIIKLNHRNCPLEILDRFRGHIQIKGYRLTSIREASTKRLSPSDVEALDCVIARYGFMGAEHLSALSHREKAWLQTKTNELIDYRLFFDTPKSDDMRQLVEQDQVVRNLVNEVRFSEESPVT
jgi:uncharacterized phage-associated protein